MSGNCNAGTCNLKAYRLSATISSLGCPQSSTEHEFNRAKTHDSYTTCWDTIRTGTVVGKKSAFFGLCPPWRSLFIMLPLQLTTTVAALIISSTSLNLRGEMANKALTESEGL